MVKNQKAYLANRTPLPVVPPALVPVLLLAPVARAGRGRRRRRARADRRRGLRRGRRPRRRGRRRRCCRSRRRRSRRRWSRRRRARRRWPRRRRLGRARRTRAALGGRVDVAPVAVHGGPVKRHVLQDGAHARGAGARARGPLCSGGVERRGVFDVEDGFARCEERGVAVAFAELGALLVHGEVDGGGEGVDYVEAVFEPDFHGVFLGFGGHPFHVVDCAGGVEV